GYKGIGPEQGRWIPQNEALLYALSRCGVQLVDPLAPEAQEFCTMLEDWFFSGNFYRTEKEETVYD
ncbi:hypothetical protein EVA_11740, partial [gut metagenome]